MVYVNCISNTDANHAMIIDFIKHNLLNLDSKILDMVNWDKCDNNNLNEMFKLSELNMNYIHIATLLILSIMTIVVYFLMPNAEISIDFLDIRLSINYIMGIWVICVTIIIIVIFCFDIVSYRFIRYLRNNGLCN